VDANPRVKPLDGSVSGSGCLDRAAPGDRSEILGLGRTGSPGYSLEVRQEVSDA
jgi:hypothetical protein